MIDLEELRARAEASKLRTVDAYGLVQLTGGELIELLDRLDRYKSGLGALGMRLVSDQELQALRDRACTERERLEGEQKGRET